MSEKKAPRHEARRKKYRLLCEALLCFFHDVFYREAKFFEEQICGTACAEGVHRDDLALVARVFIPAVRRARFHADARFHAGRHDAFLVFVRLFFVLFETGHGDDARLDPFFGKLRFCSDALFDFRTACNEQDVRRSLAVFEDIAALECRQTARRVLRQVLAGEDEGGGCRARQRGNPRRRRLLAVCGTVDFHVGNGAQCDELFHGLMRGSVFAHADGVVRENIDDGNVHECGQTDRMLAVVGEDEEGGAIALESAVQLHSVRDCRHRVLADAEVHIASRIVARRKITVGNLVRILQVGEVGGRKVCRTADEGGDECADLVEHDGGSLTGRHGLLKRKQVVDFRKIDHFARHGRFVCLCKFGICLFVFREHLLPCLFLLRAAGARLCGMRQHFSGDFEGFRARPAEFFFGLLQVFDAERGPVALVAAFERSSVADLGLADDDGGLLFFRFCQTDRRGDQADVVGILHEIDVENLPALCRKARADVFFEGDVRIPLDGDVVVVVEEDEFSQLVRPRKGARLIGDAFLEAAVAAERVRIVIDDGEAFAVEGRGEVRLGDRHADGVGDALPERTGRRLDAHRVTVFGMSRRFAAELTEVHQIFFGQTESVEIEQGIVEHGAVPRGENKAVTVVPLGVVVVEFEKFLEDRIGDGGGTERKAGVSGIRFLNCFCRKNADRVDGKLFHDLLLMIIFEFCGVQERVLSEEGEQFRNDDFRPARTVAFDVDGHDRLVQAHADERPALAVVFVEVDAHALVAVGRKREPVRFGDVCPELVEDACSQ